MKGDEEFYVAVIVYGAIGFVGLLVSSILIAVGLKYRIGIKTKTIVTKFLNLNGKERSNGQSKGGSHGHY